MALELGALPRFLVLGAGRGASQPSGCLKVPRRVLGHWWASPEVPGWKR